MRTVTLCFHPCVYLELDLDDDDEVLPDRRDEIALLERFSDEIRDDMYDWEVEDIEDLEIYYVEEC